MQRKLLYALPIIAALIFGGAMTGLVTEKEKPLVVWYVVVKHLGPDFLQKAEQYKPDIILLTVYAEDDILPLNGSPTFDLKGTVESLRSLGIKVYYSFSLFSRSAIPFDKYMEQEQLGAPLSEQNIHLADYARYLRQNDTEGYLSNFGPYLQAGLDPESIPKVLRKPVDGFYVEPGHYTAIDPLYQPYHEFMVKMIGKMIALEKPDGLAFDHGRFFTFDEGYNQDIRDWILNNSGFDIYGYTPKPPFQLQGGWSGEDRLYYDMRAQAVSHGVADIVSRFPGYPKLGTTMGMIDAARANGQYAELQVRNYDALLLMEYGKDESFVRDNVKKTAEAVGGSRVILGIFPFENPDLSIRNINIGLENGVKGVYLLGYKFPDSVHEYLLKIRGLA